MKKITRYLLPPGALIMLLSVLYTFRVDLLQVKLNRSGDQLKAKTGLVLNYDNVEWNFPTEVTFGNLHIDAPSGQTLFTADDLKYSLDGTALMTAKLVGSHLDFGKAQIDLSPEAKTTMDPQGEENVTYAHNLKEKVALFQAVSHHLPQSIDMNNLTVLIQKDSSDWKLRADRMVVENGMLNAIFSISDADNESWYAMSGEVNLPAFESSIEVVAMDDTEAPLPPKNGTPAAFRFDNLEVDTWREKVGEENEETGVLFSLEGLQITHPSLSKDQLSFPELAGDLSWTETEAGVALTPGCRIIAGELEILPELHYDREAEEVSLGMILPRQDVNRYMEAIPEGAKNVLDHLELSGEFTAHFSMDFDPSHPEKIELLASVKEKDLEVIDFGDSGLDKLASHHNTITLKKVHPLLQKCVLLAEDPHFMEHNGFDKVGAELALKENISHGRIVRGGSTLTMQLVKNLFLGPERTPARKLEEAALTWLIEQKDLASKDQLFERYLNTIEWGPEVNGIQAAAKYYFNKSPDQLELEECIFLSNIIPNPKFYHTMLDSAGRPAPFAEELFDSMKLQLWDQGLITEAELDRPYEFEFSPAVMQVLNAMPTGAQGPS